MARVLPTVDRMSALFCSILLLTNLVTRTLADSPSYDSFVFRGNSDGNVTVAVNVPAATTDDLYFQFVAPAAYSWAAFGFGGGMANALMFVVYTGSNDKGVTVSPRLAAGHVMPTFTNATQLNVLQGSGLINGSFVVNGHCKGCRKWSATGSIDVTSTAQGMIWAVGPDGGDLKSDRLEEEIQKHPANGHGTFSLDLKKATGPPGVPTLSSTAPGTSPGHTQTGDDDFGSDNGRTMIIAHGFLGCAAFLFVYPAGYLFLRVFERVWIHAGVQTFGLLLTVLTFGSGIGISMRQHISPKLTHPHQVIGILVMIFALAAWTLGLVGHRTFKKQGAPSPLMKVHRIVGPATVTLGLVNACVGFAFAGNGRAIIGFVVVALAVVIFVSTIIFLKRRRQLRQQAVNSTAAQNFRDGQAGTGPPPPQYSQGGYYHQQPEHGIPMHTYAPGRNDTEGQGHVQTISVHPK